MKKLNKKIILASSLFVGTAVFASITVPMAVNSKSKLSIIKNTETTKLTGNKKGYEVLKHDPSKNILGKGVKDREIGISQLKPTETLEGNINGVLDITVTINVQKFTTGMQGPETHQEALEVFNLLPLTDKLQFLTVRNPEKTILKENLELIFEEVTAKLEPKTNKWIFEFKTDPLFKVINNTNTINENTEKKTTTPGVKPTTETTKPVVKPTETTKPVETKKPVVKPTETTKPITKTNNTLEVIINHSLFTTVFTETETPEKIIQKFNNQKLGEKLKFLVIKSGHGIEALKDVKALYNAKTNEIILNIILKPEFNIKKHPTIKLAETKALPKPIIKTPTKPEEAVQPNAQTSLSKGAIIGIAVSGLVAVIAIAGSILSLVRRKK